MQLDNPRREFRYFFFFFFFFGALYLNCKIQNETIPIVPEIETLG